MSLLARTFHPDEANQAFTTGRLLETGQYVYKPTDHHGPTLYYAAAALQHAGGHTTTAALDGTLLRCTPLVFAVLGLACLYHAFFKLLRFTGARTGSALLQAALPVLLLGSSPLFVFFATDFIQEMLLAAFTLMMLWAGVGYRLSLTPACGRLKPGSWALLFGIAAGLAAATKETALLAFAAAGLALALAAHAARGPYQALRTQPSALRTQHLAFALVAFVLTAATLYSALGRDWMGLYNACVAAPLSYLHRAAGDAVSEGAAWHVHPWWQHLEWLFCGRLEGTRPTFPHLLPGLFLLLLAAPLLKGGGDSGGKTRSFEGAAEIMLFRFLALYTTLLIVFYSAIPYKTPWCTLQLLVPYLVTAALGALLVGKVLAARHRALRFVPLLFLCAVLGAEHARGLAQIFRDPDSSAIPYNYANASPEVRELAACVDKALAGVSNPFVAVALPSVDTWPFPWYNRAHEAVTGYWTKFEDLEALEKAGAKPSVVIVPMREGHLVQPLFPHLNRTRRFYVRPRVRVRVFWHEET